MPWKASTSRPTGSNHTTGPATSVDAPSAEAASWAALSFLSSHLDATRTATNGTKPYTGAVTRGTMFCLPKPEPDVTFNANRTCQNRLNAVLSVAPSIDT
jgi:hypothetical protein